MRGDVILVRPIIPQSGGPVASALRHAWRRHRILNRWRGWRRSPTPGASCRFLPPARVRIWRVGHCAGRRRRHRVRAPRGRRGARPGRGAGRAVPGRQHRREPRRGVAPAIPARAGGTSRRRRAARRFRRRSPARSQRGGTCAGAGIARAVRRAARGHCDARHRHRRGVRRRVRARIRLRTPALCAPCALRALGSRRHRDRARQGGTRRGRSGRRQGAFRRACARGSGHRHAGRRGQGSLRAAIRTAAQDTEPFGRTTLETWDAKLAARLAAAGLVPARGNAFAVDVADDGRMQWLSIPTGWLWRIRGSDVHVLRPLAPQAFAPAVAVAIAAALDRRPAARRAARRRRRFSRPRGDARGRVARRLGIPGRARGTHGAPAAGGHHGARPARGLRPQRRVLRQRAAGGDAGCARLRAHRGDGAGCDRPRDAPARSGARRTDRRRRIDGAAGAAPRGIGRRGAHACRR